MNRLPVPLTPFTVVLLLSAGGQQLGVAACTPPPPGLIAWWPGDGTAADIAGTNAGTLGGGFHFAPGLVGGSFEFDGTSAYVATPLDVQPSAMPSTTWEAWVYPTRLGGRQQILSDDDGGYDRSVMVEGNNFGVFTGSGVWTPAAVLANEWQHIAVVFTPTNIEFYLNGTNFSYGSAPGFGGSGTKLQLGRNPGYGEFFQGRLDEVSIYGRALSSDEIMSVYAAGMAGKCKPALPTSDLAVGLTALQSSIGLSETVTYQLLITNHGPQTATGIVVQDLLPTSLIFVSADNPAGTFTQFGNTISFTLAQLAIGEYATLSLAARGATAGIATNLASAYGNESDLLFENNSAALAITVTNVRQDAENGNWADRHVILTNTPEAELMIRTGDIDNLNFGWPSGFDPFSGNSTPAHAFPWTVNTNDPAGTDRIMVPTSYVGTPPYGQDGYTGSTSRPDNLPQAIVLSNSVSNLTVRSAVFQMFVDDFQAPVWGASYQVTINGVRAPFLEEVINQLNQTGPIGRLITVQVPSEFLGLVSTGEIKLFIDDPTTGAGDGYAIDFVKLLLNTQAFAQIGTISGTVRDSLLSQPVPKVLVSAGSGLVQAVTDAAGQYVLTNVPAGLVFVTASKFGFAPQTQSLNLVAGQSLTLNFELAVVPKLRLLQVTNEIAVLRWPAPLSDWILERTLALDGMQNWQEITNSRSIVDAETEVQCLAPDAAAFYRLRKP